MFQAATNRAQRIIHQLALARELGLEPAALLQTVGLNEADLKDPDGRVPVLKSIKLLQIIADTTGDPDLGLKLGQRFKISQAGVVGYAMAYSDDIGSAVNRLVRFRKILNQRSEAIFERSGDNWLLTITNEPLIEGFRPALDDYMAAIVVGLGQLMGRQLVPARVCLTYERPSEVSLHREIFGARIEFGCRYQAIELWRRDVERRLPSADPQLTGYLDELAEIRLGELPSDNTFAARVRQAVWPRLSEGQPTIGIVAADLAVSSRTLQRRLREENTSYAQVVESLRKEKASLLLGDSSLAVYEVGYLLGYSDPSAFYRAFRRWYGCSPSRHRQLMS